MTHAPCIYVSYKGRAVKYRIIMGNCLGLCRLITKVAVWCVRIVNVGNVVCWLLPPSKPCRIQKLRWPDFLFTRDYFHWVLFVSFHFVHARRLSRRATRNYWMFSTCIAVQHLVGVRRTRTFRHEINLFNGNWEAFVVNCVLRTSSCFVLHAA